MNNKQKEKAIGYLLRIGAVIIWGLEPLIIRYSPISDIRFDLQAPLLLLGATIFTFLSVLFLGKKVVKENYKLKLDWYFVVMALSMMALILFLILGSQYTSGTSFILLGGFAPILALLIGFIFWKTSTSYFSDRANILKMFIVFFLGGVGVLFIFYKDIVFGNSKSLIGDIFAICYMFADVAFAIAQIRYTKRFKGYEVYFLNFYLYFVTFLSVLPLMIYYYSYFLHLPFVSIVWAIGLGILWGLGTLLTFEAYKRMDGFIAFLMFNISILITIFVESFVLEEIKITSHLLWGASLIIGASILAEVINTNSEKANI